MHGLRAHDTVARVGGHEFVLLFSGLSQVQETRPILRRVLDRLRASFTLHDGTEAAISASIGVAYYPRDGATAEVLLLAADTAMYAAKREGRNQVRQFQTDAARPIADVTVRSDA